MGRLLVVLSGEASSQARHYPNSLFNTYTLTDPWTFCIQCCATGSGFCTLIVLPIQADY